MRIRRFVCLIAMLCGAPALAQFQAPPPALLHIDTRPAQTVPPGEILLRIGLGYESDVVPVPLLETPRGDLWQGPKVQLGIPIGPKADLDISIPLVQHLEIDQGQPVPRNGGYGWEPGGSKTEAGDLVVSTRVLFRAEPETGPAVGMRFGLKVPSASDETGLGSDEADVFAQLLLSQPAGNGTLHANLGIAILGDPRGNRSQQDLVSYGVAWETRPGPRTAFYLEVSGLLNTSDSERGEEGVARTGFSWDVGLGRGAWEGSILYGYEDASADWGVAFARLFRFGREAGP